MCAACTLPVAPFVGKRPGVAASFARLITQDDAVVGNIYVNVYTDTLDTKRAFDDRVNVLSTGALGPVSFATSPIGDEGVLWVNGDSTFLVYRRCHAYVNINLPASQDATLRYARDLDARISPAVCS